MKLKIALGVSLAGALAATGFFLHSRRYAVDEPVAARYEATLREVTALNFRRSSEILRSRSGLVRHYDDLAAVERRLRRAHAALGEAPAFLAPAHRSEQSARVAESERTRQSAEQVVELFKRELAVLRNSTGFLTALARDVAEFRPATPEGSSLVSALDSFLRDLLALQVTHDRSAAEVAKAALVRLRSSDPRAGEWTAADLPLVLRHGELAIEKSELVDELLAELEALPTERAARAALDHYLMASASARTRQDDDRALLVGLCFLGAAAMASYVILRLRRDAAALEAASGELGHAVESLREERNKHFELAEQRSRFVSTTSHEFRTPLSVILSSAEMLGAYGERWSSDKTIQHLSRIRNAALSMTRMLEDVLLLGRAESAQLTYSPAPLELRAFCDELVSSAELADGGAHRVNVDVEPSDRTIVADESLLRHALGNLLSNALKYSAREQLVDFRARVDGSELEFSVVDRGIGISADDQRHLFTSFRRGSNVGRIRGSGLGLSIVRHAVDLQNGSLALESDLGRGTRVVVRIPLEQNPDMAA